MQVVGMGSGLIREPLSTAAWGREFNRQAGCCHTWPCGNRTHTGSIVLDVLGTDCTKFEMDLRFASFLDVCAESKPPRSFQKRPIKGMGDSCPFM